MGVGYNRDILIVGNVNYNNILHHTYIIHEQITAQSPNEVYYGQYYNTTIVCYTRVTQDFVNYDIRI